LPSNELRFSEQWIDGVLRRCNRALHAGERDNVVCEVRPAPDGPPPGSLWLHIAAAPETSLPGAAADGLEPRQIDIIFANVDGYSTDSPQPNTRPRDPKKGDGYGVLRTFPSPSDDLAPLFRALEFSPDPVFVTDRRNQIVFWNDAARQFLGFPIDDAVGADCTELLRGCDQFGNRYCSEQCPIMRMANRGEIVREFGITFETKSEQLVASNVTVIQLRAGPDEYFLLHLLRGSEQRAPRETADPPRPRLVSTADSVDARARKLTARELEVLRMLAAGRTTPEVAERLHISQLTARSHIQNILEKLEVHSKAEAVAFAYQKNLI
jgi:DNA-binding CsgD family transcriptional regulator